jgi:type II secretory pathway pseudopilin PulG
MRRGCVLTIVILSVISLVLSVLFYVFVWPETKKIGTSGFAYVIEDALEQYKSDQNSYPPGAGNAEVVKALYGENPRKKKYLESMKSIVRDGEFTDFWKNPMKIEFPPEEGAKAKVTSAGPNGVFGDADDITSQAAKDKWDKSGSSSN